MRKIFLGLVLLAILFIISAKSIDASENYLWANSKSGPATVEEAKKLFGKRQLVAIEGIYNSNSLGTVFIIRDTSEKKRFKMFIIDSRFDFYNQTWEATFVEGSGGWDLFQRDRTIRNETRNGRAFFENGALNLEYDNSYNKVLLRKFWPENLSEYNEQFITKSKNQTNTITFDDMADDKSYSDYWWVLILIVAVVFFIYTQAGKELKIIKSNKNKSNESHLYKTIIQSLSLKDPELKKNKKKNPLVEDKKKDFKDYLG